MALTSIESPSSTALTETSKVSGVISDTDLSGHGAKITAPQNSHLPNQIDLVRTYLREIGRVPLLTCEQEIVYGKQVRQMRSLLEAKEALAKKLRYELTLGEWAMHVHVSETELNDTVRRGQRAKQKMIEANLRLVVAITKRYQKRGLELLELIQEGTLGLQRGVEKFDPTKGYKFSTYAYWWIRQAITRAIGEQGRTIRLPIHIVEKLNRIKKTQRLLSQRMGRTPTLTEVADELGLTPLQMREYLERSRLPMSLDVRVGNHQDTGLGELIEDSTNTCPEELLMQSELAAELEPLLAELKPQQRQILSLRFGLGDFEPLTLTETGRQLKLSREQIRQIEKMALKQLSGRYSQLGQSGDRTSPVAHSAQGDEVSAEAELSTESGKPEQLKLFDWSNGQAIVDPESSFSSAVK